MKKVIIGLGLILLAAGCSNDNKRETKIIANMNAACQLTPDQKSKVAPLIEDFLKVKRSNEDQYASDPAGLKKANEANRQDYLKKLQTVLSPEQYEEFQAYTAKQRAAKQKKGEIPVE